MLLSIIISERKIVERLMPEIREIRMKYFDSRFIMRSKSFIPHRNKIIFYYIVKGRSSIKFVTH